MISSAPMTIEQEFAGSDLGDKRLNRRLIEIAKVLAENPEKSFPKASGTAAQLRGTYRFMNNDSVTPDGVLDPHRKQTTARARQAGEVLVLHDTTELEFPGDEHREGLGFLRSAKDDGFLLHCSLVVSADGTRRPLGVIASRTWARSTRKGPRSNHRAMMDETNEGRRWAEQVEEAEQRLDGASAIHVADREVDSFINLQTWVDNDRRFVVRARNDRVVVDEHDERDGYASEAIAAAPWLVELDVPLSRRRATKIPSGHAARDARRARLRVSATSLRLKWPNHIPSARRDCVDVRVVHAVEVDPPKDAVPVSWVLYTTEPVTTAQQATWILEIYRTRWLIEEFFKALKTGCAIEKRQLESYGALVNALAVFLPIAWQALTLRGLHRASPRASATEVLSSTQIEVLRAKFPKMMPANPTVDDALSAVAYLGGHFIKKLPGWLVLCRGMEDLYLLEAGWRLAQNSPRNCGQ